MPVWSKHFGHGTPLDRLPAVNKPLMVGESGGTYYARPKQMAEFNGPRAYESYAGRNEALAIDVYDNIVRMALPRLAYFSASETAWFGVEHLNFGYRDFTRLPGKDDGVFFTKPFVEGKPGIQPERLPPYVAALNPGWDPSLPLYKPLAMFDAQKAALAKDGPQPSPWSQRTQTPPRPAAPAPTIEKVGFIGDRNGPLARRLVALGVPLAEGAQAFNIADGVAPTEDTPGTTLVMLSGANASALQPFNCSLTDRSATALVPDAAHPWTAPFTLPDLYFAEDGPDRFIMRHGSPGRPWTAAACCCAPATRIGRCSTTRRNTPSAPPSCCTSISSNLPARRWSRPSTAKASCCSARSTGAWPPARRTRSGGGCSPTPASSSANPPMRTSPRSTSMVLCSTRSPSAGFPPRASRPR